MEGAMTLDEWAKAGKGETWRVATGELHNLIDEALDRLGARDEELRQSRAERDRLAARIAELERLCNGEIEMREHVEAERDAAVEALEWIKSEGMDDGDIHGCDQFTLAEAAIMLLNRAREALARLPQAALRAQAQRDVIAAARDVASDVHPKDYSEILGRLSDALARLDALDGGGGSDG